MVFGVFLYLLAFAGNEMAFSRKMAAELT